MREINSKAEKMSMAQPRAVNVVPAEKENGEMEYKRQVYKPSATRVRTLATQMSYRLDEGMGRCTYLIGVEDDGCHSLLDYSSVSESARMLECIARSLNSIVLTRKMIQNEINHTTNNTKNNTNAVANKNGELVMYEVYEPTLFPPHNNINIDNTVVETEDEKEEKCNDNDTNNNSSTSIDGNSTCKQQRELNKENGAYTRCELVIQRVETHLLDPSPVSFQDLTTSASTTTKDRTLSCVSDGVEGATEATTLSREDNKNGNNNNVENLSINETLSSRNIRVAVVGNVDAGKSTLIGTLTTSCLDNGRGGSRTAIMKHRHEIESGRTSSCSTHLMGFRHSGEPISGRDSIRANKRKSEDEIARESYRIVTLMDLAGHEKYLKTTIHGVSSGMADYSLILVNARHPPTHMTQHHLNLCCSFGIPVIVVFTKMDGCPEHAVKTSKSELFKLLRAPDVGKKPFAVRNEQDVATVMGKLQSLAPVIDTSCVTGEGLDLLRKLLFSLPKRRRHETKVNRPFEFLVEDVFNVPGVGAVVSGFVNAGELTVGGSSNDNNAQVDIGPMDDGTFIKTVVKSAHIARIHTSHVTSGQSACLALSMKKEDRLKLRKGMVALQTENPFSTKYFDAEICVLKGEGTTIRKSYQAYVHILNVRQSAFARNIEIVNNNAIGLPSNTLMMDDPDDGIVLRPGSRAKVRFEFAKRPEYIRPGMRMLFRDGRVRGVGIITGIPPPPSVVAK